MLGLKYPSVKDLEDAVEGREPPRCAAWHWEARGMGEEVKD